MPAALCRSVNLPRGAQWLPRIGNNHSLVTAKLRFNAWESAWSIHARQCHVRTVEECAQSKGARNEKKTLVAFAVAVEEGVIVVDVSFVAITSNINKQDDTHFLHLRV